VVSAIFFAGCDKEEPTNDDNFVGSALNKEYNDDNNRSHSKKEIHTSL
jgi:hypothetical protein